MDDFDDLGVYNGDSVHDGWVDFSYNENTDDLSDYFGEDDSDECDEDSEDDFEDIED